MNEFLCIFRLFIYLFNNFFLFNFIRFSVSGLFLLNEVLFFLPFLLKMKNFCLIFLMDLRIINATAVCRIAHGISVYVRNNWFFFFSAVFIFVFIYLQKKKKRATRLQLNIKQQHGTHHTPISSEVSIIIFTSNWCLLSLLFSFENIYIFLIITCVYTV